MKRRSFLQTLFTLPAALVATEATSTPVVPPTKHVPSGSGNITNLAHPTPVSDVATKQYMDSATHMPMHKIGVEYPDGSKEVCWVRCISSVINPHTFESEYRPAIDTQTMYRASVVVDMTDNRVIKHRFPETIVGANYFSGAPEVEQPKYKRVVPVTERTG
jgi:hypothetical protein